MEVESGVIEEEKKYDRKEMEKEVVKKDEEEKMRMRMRKKGKIRSGGEWGDASVTREPHKHESFNTCMVVY